MVRREVFDNFLCEKAAEAGTEVLDRTALKALRESAAGWTVITDKDEFECSFIAACDGAKGQTASLLGFNDRKRSIAGAIEAEHSKPMSEPVLHLELGMVRRGYLWNFPKADGQSLGIGVFRRKQKESADPIRDRLDDYVKRFGLELRDCEQHGHPINLWKGHQRLHTRKAVLVGDAACLVDPFTAEGIRPSIRCARIAADALLEAMENGAELDGYSRRVQQEIGEEMKWASRIASVFYQFPQAGYRAFAESPTGTQRLGQLLTGERTYKDLARSAIKRLKAKIGL
jgi:flavin-dependent dehydrogenase